MLHVGWSRAALRYEQLPRPLLAVQRAQLPDTIAPTAPRGCPTSLRSLTVIRPLDTQATITDTLGLQQPNPGYNPTRADALLNVDR